MSKASNHPTAGIRPAWATGAGRPLVSPLQSSAVYVASTPDELDEIYEGRVPGYTYAREGHPNADVLARQIDALEGIQGGTITGSGMAAISSIFLGLLKAGDHVLGGDQLYGRSLRQLTEDLPRMGIETSLADACDRDAMQAALLPNTRVILIEAVSNPTIRIADVESAAALARQVGAMLVVDNTFATPLGFDAFGYGADIVVHSVTKLLAGHSDVTLGYVVAKDPALNEKISTAVATWGLTPSPFDCWLAERGMLSFPLRYERACFNSAELASTLAELPGVKRVLYPTRSDHPDAARAGMLSEQGGNMLSFEIVGGRSAANKLTSAAQPIAFAPTLGDISTTLSHPASSSHRSMSDAAQADIGISEGFFRVSVGVEDIEFLKDTFSKAIAASQEK